MTKSLQRSVRMREDVARYVDSQAGDSFNQKFEDLVLYFKDEKPNREKQLKELDKLIADKKKELVELLAKLDRFNFINKQLKQVENTLNYIEKDLGELK